MKDAVTDPKQQAILGAAWMAFSRYGFRKTSMDDIAKGAGMSRPAVYLHFKNKEAIFRALVAKYYSTARADIRAALATEEPVAGRLLSAFQAQGGEAMEAMLSSPHGLEVFEAGMSVASEAIEEGEASLRCIYAQWLQAEAAAGRVALAGDPAEIARTFCAAMKGIKHTAADYAAYQAGVRQLAQLFSAGIMAR
jgi:AcrR family transcriptional regulator